MLPTRVNIINFYPHSSSLLPFYIRRLSPLSLRHISYFNLKKQMKKRDKTAAGTQRKKRNFMSQVLFIVFFSSDPKYVMCRPDRSVARGNKRMENVYFFCSVSSSAASCTLCRCPSHLLLWTWCGETWTVNFRSILRRERRNVSSEMDWRTTACDTRISASGRASPSTFEMEAKNEKKEFDDQQFIHDQALP